MTQENPKQGPKNVTQALKATTQTLSDEELAALESDTDDNPTLFPVAPPQDPTGMESGLPEWFKLPEGMQLPVGREIIFLRFRAKWTDTPTKGDRTCALWNITAADERMALKRTKGDATRTLSEMAKQTIRILDGQRTDWTRGASSNVEVFWNDIGAKCRQQIISAYLKTHSMTAEEEADFFGQCMTVRSVAF